MQYRSVRRALKISNVEKLALFYFAALAVPDVGTADGRSAPLQILHYCLARSKMDASVSR